MAPMKMTSISISNINMANYSNHRVRKVKQLLNLNGQNKIKNAKRIMYVNLNVFCTIFRCDLSIVHGGRDYIKTAKCSAAEISAANIHKKFLKQREKTLANFKNVGNKKYVIAATANHKRPSR